MAFNQVCILKSRIEPEPLLGRFADPKFELPENGGGGGMNVRLAILGAPHLEFLQLDKKPRPPADPSRPRHPYPRADMPGNHGRYGR